MFQFRIIWLRNVIYLKDDNLRFIFQLWQFLKKVNYQNIFLFWTLSFRLCNFDNFIKHMAGFTKKSLIICNPLAKSGLNSLHRNATPFKRSISKGVAMIKSRVGSEDWSRVPILFKSSSASVWVSAIRIDAALHDEMHFTKTI